MEQKIEKRKVFVHKNPEELINAIQAFTALDHIKARFEQYKPINVDGDIHHCLYLQYYEIVEE